MAGSRGVVSCAAICSAAVSLPVLAHHEALNAVNGAAAVPADAATGGESAIMLLAATLLAAVVCAVVRPRI